MSPFPLTTTRFILDENINNNTGISIFAIFDGHGGDFAADFAKDVLIQNVYNKITEAHNIITGKVDPKAVKDKKECDGADGDKPSADNVDVNGNEEKPKSPAALTASERRNSFRKTTSFTDDSIKKGKQPDPLDIYKLNSLVRPMTKDDFFNPSATKGQNSATKTAPKSLEAKCYIADGKINFGKLLTDEVLAADYKLVETVKKMVRERRVVFPTGLIGRYCFSGQRRPFLLYIFCLK